MHQPNSERSVLVPVLSEELTTQLAEKLTAKLGRDVRIANHVNESLIGGMIIRANDLVIDKIGRAHV